jgi:hypothetical protein
MSDNIDFPKVAPFEGQEGSDPEYFDNYIHAESVLTEVREKISEYGWSGKALDSDGQIGQFLDNLSPRLARFVMVMRGYRDEEGTTVFEDKNTSKIWDAVGNLVLAQCYNLGGEIGNTEQFSGNLPQDWDTDPRLLFARAATAKYKATEHPEAQKYSPFQNILDMVGQDPVKKGQKLDFWTDPMKKAKMDILLRSGEAEFVATIPGIIGGIKPAESVDIANLRQFMDRGGKRVNSFSFRQVFAYMSIPDNILLNANYRMAPAPQKPIA